MPSCKMLEILDQCELLRSEKQNCGKQAMSEENDLQALLASVLVPLAFGTLANSLLKSILRA